MQTRKKVLLVVIDALASNVVVPAINDGRLPCLAELVRRGQLTDSTAIFPSVTPAATASIVTGHYPRQHGIVGAHWWNSESNTVSFFGADLWMIYNAGVGKYFRDFMVRLNEKFLKTDPVFQSIERQGLTAAVINFMWFRGDQRHPVNAPLMLELLGGSGIPETVAGPTHLALADFVPLRFSKDEPAYCASGGLLKRFGFHDDCTADYLEKLFASDETPDLTVAYFPNNDFESHQVGPESALDAVAKVDEVLSRIIELRSGMDQFLTDYSIVVTGDHSQSVTLDDADEREIRLDELLSDFQQASPGQPWQDGDQVLICPNLRAAQIYTNQSMSQPRFDELTKTLLAQQKIDQVIIQRDQDDHDEFTVLTADRGCLAFQPYGSNPSASNPSDSQPNGGCQVITDVYGNQWQFAGDLTAVDATDVDGQIHYGQYPNALERIANGFPEHSAAVWLTAKVGHEFSIAETHSHPGGSHGTLHRLDSTSPLIAAGLPPNVAFPTDARTIDIAPLCKDILGCNNES